MYRAYRELWEDPGARKKYSARSLLKRTDLREYLQEIRGTLVSDRIRAGIIGTGTRGRIWKEIVERHPAFNLVAVSDAHRPNIPRQETFSYYENYRDLLSSGVDAVFVASQNKYRARVATEALDRGIHVLCDVPPGRSVQDLLDIISAEKKGKGTVLGFAFTHRFCGAVIRAKEMINSGTCGRILWMRGIHGKSGGRDFESIWRSNREWAGGGVLLDQGIHMVDLFRFFAGDFKEVKSFVTTSFWNITLEDNAFALLRNSQNQVAMIHASATHWRNQFALEICLENGYIVIRGDLSPHGEYGPLEELIVCPREPDYGNYASGISEERVTVFDTRARYEHEIDSFADCISNGSNAQLGSSGDALQAMKLVFRIYRKAAGGRSRTNPSSR